MSARNLNSLRRGVDVKDGWWGYKLMIIEDPDGNQLYFAYPKSDEQQ